MQEAEIKERLKNAIVNETPDCFNQIVERSNHTINNNYMNQTNSKQTKKIYTPFFIGLASCIVCVFIILGTSFYKNNEISTIIEFDINPSISLSANEIDEVIDIIPLNQDASHMIEELDFKHKQINVVTKELVNLMIKEGYLDKEKHTILITVKNEDIQKEETLKTEIFNNIKIVFDEENISGSILVQSVGKSREIEKLSKEYKISSGKATFLKTLVSENPEWSIEELAELNLEQISKKIEEENCDMENIISKPNKEKDTVKSDVEPNVTASTIPKDTEAPKTVMTTRNPVKQSPTPLPNDNRKMENSQNKKTESTAQKETTAKPGKSDTKKETSQKDTSDNLNKDITIPSETKQDNVSEQDKPNIQKDKKAIENTTEPKNPKAMPSQQQEDKNEPNPNNIYEKNNREAPDQQQRPNQSR